jgi:XisH protein
MSSEMEVLRWLQKTVFTMLSNRKLYLAISLPTYEVVFIRRFIQSVIERSKVSLIIYDTDKEIIVKWQI